MITEDVVKDILKRVDDPELGHNIVDLGLIYSVEIVPQTTTADTPASIVITMTLTTPGCPMGSFFINQVKETVAAAVRLEPDDIEVNIVFDPPWSPEAMSPDLRLELGL